MGHTWPGQRLLSFETGGSRCKRRLHRIFHLIASGRNWLFLAHSEGQRTLWLLDFFGSFLASLFRDTRLPGVIGAQALAYFLPPTRRTCALQGICGRRSLGGRWRHPGWLLIEVQSRFTKAAQFRAALIDSATLLTGLDHRAVLRCGRSPVKGQTYPSSETARKRQPFRGCLQSNNAAHQFVEFFLRWKGSPPGRLALGVRHPAAWIAAAGTRC